MICVSLVADGMGSTLKVLWDINLVGSLLVSQRFRKTIDYGVEDRPEYLKM
jgi:hypothetical protein